MNQVYIIDGIRTPIGKLKGSLSSVRPDDMAAFVIKKLLERNPNIDQSRIYDVVLGCANQAGEDNRNIARMSALLSGLDYHVPGETVNRLCASGLSAAINAARSIQVGDADLMISGGVENMTRGPLVISKSESPFGGDAKIYDTTFGWRFINPKMKEIYGVDAMGETAENLAERDNISREDQDLFAFNSQRKTKIAQENGRLSQEIVPVNIPQRKGDDLIFDKDEFPKNDTTLEGLSKLRTVFKKEGTVTAGNASGLNDGAAVNLLASENAIKEFGLTPKARIVSSAVVGVEPRLMGIGPVKATELALKKAGLTFNDIDIIELNEAFAAQSLACIRAWGLDDNDSRINPNGGAIALGHPLGMSGARILNSAMYELHNQNKKYALATMCVGLGQGFAVVIEKV
ncbi:3-oxoadipyl-CoA thiolase [Epilithonimonas vandammei]|uniref:Beta-ketoadipyl-CoA thiolase n=1 Tax=Epilithonimonas vandammei TaxID=2487072 RepID=A0A3G8YD37_9FLAO|nr:3-oxoadipyl-CoA thiolase [Epilithonimonas vandammei]AZI39131.1 3-oxoadipyl-CoA thiolase [Epilithonimonas vandammei]